MATVATVYGFHISLLPMREEDADKRYDGPAAALGLLACESPYRHALCSLQASPLK